LCDLDRHAERYVGQSVHTRAELIDTGVHGWFLQDSDCNALVLFGGYADEAQAQRMLTILMPWAVRSGPGSHVYISVTGVVSFGKNRAGGRAPFLAITDVDAAEVTPKHRKLSARK
jgi:hypothetical protein